MEPFGGPKVCTETVSVAARHSEQVLPKTGVRAPQPRAEDDSARDSGNDEDLDDIDMKSLRIHCKCPCGSTNLLHCVKSPPHCLKRRYSNQHPELDLTQGPERDQRRAMTAMCQHLMSETTKIKAAFSAYGMTVYRYAKSITGITAHLKQMLRLDGRDGPHLVTFDDAYNAITHGMDFLNFEPLSRVLHECNCIMGCVETESRSAAMNNKSQYEGEFKKYAQHRVFSYKDGLQALCPPVQEGVYNMLKIKVEESFRKFLIDRLYEFKRVIREVLGIPEATFLRVTDVKDGCTEISMEVLGNIDVEKTFTMDVEKKKALASHHISMLEYGGKVYYCCCNLFSDETSYSLLESLYAKQHLDDDLEEERHSPDCPAIKHEKLECPFDECPYCRTRLHFCLLEVHTLGCEERPDSVTDTKSVGILYNPTQTHFAPCDPNMCPCAPAGGPTFPGPQRNEENGTQS